MTLGRPRHHERLTTSTNDLARAFAREGAPHGTLVTAREQSSGRGRQGRTWSAPAGTALLMSLVVREPPRLLPLVAAVAVAEEAGGEAVIKWPNDVLDAAGRKLAGILAEGRPQEGWAVLGIGLNVAVDPVDLPPELRATAGGLGRHPDEIEATLARLLRRLEHRLMAPTAEILDAFRARDALRGRDITWTGGVGSAQGIDGDGRLIVADTAGHRLALDAGEVHLSG
jgi:BirA family biotin operon repressor/biotin-[acetyl-CoA-carboxylase] ligase